jgi:hypothetical protein
MWKAGTVFPPSRALNQENKRLPLIQMFALGYLTVEFIIEYVLGAEGEIRHRLL